MKFKRSTFTNSCIFDTQILNKQTQIINIIKSLKTFCFCIHIYSYSPFRTLDTRVYLPETLRYNFNPSAVSRGNRMLHLACSCSFRQESPSGKRSGGTDNRCIQTVDLGDFQIYPLSVWLCFGMMICYARGLHCCSYWKELITIATKISQSHVYASVEEGNEYTYIFL